MPTSGIRRGLTALAIAAVTLGIVNPVTAGSQPPVEGAARKVEPALLADLGGGGRAATVIEFTDTADLSAASRIKDWNQRGRAVVDALQSTAKRSQAAVADQLTRQGVHYQSFWIDNTIYVADGTAPLAMAAAADAHVKSVRTAQTVPLQKPVAGKALATAAGGVEWGIADIKADQVWQTFGDRGEGIVVANIDSGVQFDHPALVAAYRGNRGDGSFDHNYNWWDPSSVCGSPSLAPCDNNSHGTHTMGTMVGDGGDGNHIGVAPGAKWIAAKGCESGGCSEFALTSSAQWVLAPTDLAGANPDPAKRPNIVNNSWGSAGGDDWYRDFVHAWVASGMFPAFAAGNDGPACGTAGSPGDYDESYAVGNYAAGGTISPRSSRGAAASGQTKPDISAPGTNVRSSVPGGRYAAYDGTSMATPHVAGTVALMWSRSPALVGDIEGTRQLLDDTARDHADAQCGGTPDDNNVYGEGELDALAAVSAVPTGDVGRLSGTVTDVATGKAIAGAVLAFTGPSARNATSRPDGTYSISLTQGGYDVAVSIFGYRTAHLSVVVTGGQAATRDVALSEARRVVMSGQVRDGSGHGWPLYAKVVVEDTPVSTYTDPVTGRYSVQLPEGSSYAVDVESQYPGYVGQTQQVEVDAPVTRDYMLTADAASCSAPGYRRGAAGLHQSFDSGATPAGWAVVDNGSTGQVWRFADDGGHGNLTGGTGRFAVLDSYKYGVHGQQDASLASPPTNLRAVADPVLEFRTDFKDYFHDRADVDLSLDGGSTWTNVWRPSADVRGPTKVRVPLPTAANQPSVQVRFHYGPRSYGWWWQVDDVYVGSSGCEKAPGGLLLGRTTSSVTGKGLAGVAVGTEGAVPSTSAATPDDTRLGDGLYWLFASAGSGASRYTAALVDYSDRTEKIQVRSDAATRHDFALESGRLTAPRSITATVELGRKSTVEIDLANTGDQPATYELGEREAGGDVAAKAAAATATDVPVLHIPVHANPLPGTETETTTVPMSHPVGGEWTDLPNYPLAVEDPVVGVYGGRLYSFTGGGTNPASYRYDPATQVWTQIADAPIAREAATGAYVGGGRFVVTGGIGGIGGTDSAPVAATSIYDADTDTWSAGAPNPAPSAGAGSAVLDGKLYVVGGCLDTCGRTDVLRYDPASDQWTRLADFPYAVARSSCGGIGSTLYCAGGIGPEADGLATWAYTPATNSWHRVADMPQDMWGGGSAVVGDELVVSGGVVNHGSMKTNESYAYDPAANRWRTLPNRQYALFKTSAACGFFTVGGTDGERFIYPFVEQLPGFGDCALPAHVGWLSVDRPSRTVPPGHSQIVRVTLDASRVTQPGTYLASLRVAERTPHPVAPITVRLVVKPPR